MGINPGIGYSATNLGGTYSLDIDQSIDWSSRNVGRQFECILSGKKVGESAEYYLQVRKGLVEFDYYGTTDKGILDIDNLGGFNGTNTQNLFFYMNKFNVFPTGSKTTGSNVATSDYISDGYIKLEKLKNYFVFIYKTTPDWKQSETELFEAKAPQICVAEDASEPNIFIKTQRNGGGLIQNYLLKTTKTLQLPVIGEGDVIGTFDAAQIGVDFNLGGFSDDIWTFGTIDVTANIAATDVVGKVEDKGVGFITTDLYRQDIAYIKWDAALNRFKLYQMQYGPIKLRQNPVGSMKNKILTEESQEAKWDTGFDLCNYATGSFSGYTKNLNSSFLADQPPLYAGYENIGNYQNPKETL